MPQMANITVKKADGTTDIVYTALTPSAGDNTPAKWRSDTANAVQGFRPMVTMYTRNSNGGSGRLARLGFTFPVVRTVGDEDKRVGTIPGEVTLNIGNQFTDAEIAEAVHQLTNLMVATLIRDSLKAGYAPT